MAPKQVISRKQIKGRGFYEEDPLDLVICLDTTQSMDGCMKEIKKTVINSIEDILEKSEDTKIALYAHNDYNNSRHRGSFVTSYADFTASCRTLEKFISRLSQGIDDRQGDRAECYELAMHEIATKLSWRKDSKRVLIMIGDSFPHEPKDYRAFLIREYPNYAGETLDWKEEAQNLIDMGVRILPLQYGDSETARYFWQALAFMSHSYRLNIRKNQHAGVLLSTLIHHSVGGKLYEQYTERFERQYGNKAMSHYLTTSLQRLKLTAGGWDAIGIEDETHYEWITDEKTKGQEEHYIQYSEDSDDDVKEPLPSPPPYTEKKTREGPPEHNNSTTIVHHHSHTETNNINLTVEKKESKVAQAAGVVAATGGAVVAVGSAIVGAPIVAAVGIAAAATGTVIAVVDKVFGS